MSCMFVVVERDGLMQCQTGHLIREVPASCVMTLHAFFLLLGK